MRPYIPLILASVCLNALAQLLLKQGMRVIGRFELAADQLIALPLKVALSPYVLGGMACYGLSIGLWLVVLSRVEVSAAAPFLSIGFIIIAVAGFWFFGERLSPQRIFGIALICGGVSLVAHS